MAGLCRNLNKCLVDYVVVGGLAVIHLSYNRATGDIDLLVDDSSENIARIRKALAYLPDGQVDQIADTDLAQYQVVRVSGGITVDLMVRACEVTYAQAKDHIEFDEIHGIKIPFLKPDLLIKTKLGICPKDIQDRVFLEHLLDQTKGK